jgi:predicted dinucleotide-binding enzyme
VVDDGVEDEGVIDVAVVGAGAVGRALGGGLARLDGITVTYAVRDPDDERHADLGPVATHAAACADADLVVLAIPAAAVTDVVPTLGLTAGQHVVDATNAVRMPVPDGHASMGDLVASLLPSGVFLAKAFNTIGAEHLGAGHIGDDPLFLPIAGDDTTVEMVVPLAEALGFEAVSVGGREAFELVEDHARLWIQLAFVCGWGRGFGFAVRGR